MKFIPVNEPMILKSDINFIKKSLSEGWVSSESPYVTKFEKELSRRNKRKYGVCVSSGTAALVLAIKSLNLKKNDEVILPNFTIISGISELINIGCKLIFCEPNEYTYNVEANSIIKKISNKTRLIIISHIYGLTVDISKITRAIKNKNIKIIEDAAEVQGGYINEQPCGSYGDISIFSFYANKQITTGEGGVCLTNSEILSQRLRKLRNLYFNNKRRFIHDKIAENYRMSSLQAALGLSQLKRLKEIIKLRKKIGMTYYKKLKPYEKYLQLPIISTNYTTNIFWVFPIVLKTRHGANYVIKKLLKYNIGSRNFFYPLSNQPLFNNKYKKENSISMKLYKKGLYLPSSLNLDEKKIEFIVKKLIQIIT